MYFVDFFTLPLVTFQIKDLEAPFKTMDKTGDGQIEFGDMKVVLKKNLGLSATEAKKVFEKIQTVGGSNRVAYTDFIAAASATKVALDDYMIQEAFQKFDVENKGFITAKDLKEVLGATFNNEPTEKLIERIDKQGTDKIYFKMFKTVMMSNKQGINQKEEGDD